MKKSILFACLLSVALFTFGDVPLDDNGFKMGGSTANYFPWVMGLMSALGILIFMYVYKNESSKK